MNRLLREARQWQASPAARPGVASPVDVAATAEAYIVRVDLPGVGRDEVRVCAEEGALSIVGAKAPDEGSEGMRRLRGEREYGGFSRVISLPSDADLDRVTATLAQGVLAVQVARKRPGAARRIEVRVAGG